MIELIKDLFVTQHKLLAALKSKSSKALLQDKTAQTVMRIKPKSIDRLLNRSDKEHQAHVKEISVIFNNPAFKSELALMIYEQTKFIAAEAETWEQVLIGRGTLNGLELFKDRFALLNSESLDKSKPEGEFNKFEVI